jgi:hypothetical protein
VVILRAKYSVLLAGSKSEIIIRLSEHNFFYYVKCSHKEYGFIYIGVYIHLLVTRRLGIAVILRFVFGKVPGSSLGHTTMSRDMFFLVFVRL